jgi:hypothetical protein
MRLACSVGDGRDADMVDWKAGRELVHPVVVY